jgi:hypothetical protein
MDMITPRIMGFWVRLVVDFNLGEGSRVLSLEKR